MTIMNIIIANIIGLFLSCSPQESKVTLSSWNDTSVKKQLQEFLNKNVENIPLEDCIAVFDMDGTLVCEKPWCIETIVSIHRLLELG